MAAMPVRRELVRMIEARGGEMALLERIASGEYLKNIAASFHVKRPDGSVKPISASMILWFFRKTPERWERYIQARRAAAMVYVEESLEIADETPMDQPYAAAAARNRIITRHWIASRIDREQWGDPNNAPNTQVHIGTLHLNALKQLGGPKPQIEGEKIELADIEVIEAETVPDAETVE